VVGSDIKVNHGMAMFRPGSMRTSDVWSAGRQSVKETAYTIGVRDARGALETDVAIAERKTIINYKYQKLKLNPSSQR
jgi:hypothetical protein